MKFLILGSSGQIGSALCEYLLKQNHSVVKFDIEQDPYQDLRIEHVLNSWVKDIDFVSF